MKVKAYSSVMQQRGSSLSPAYHARRTPTVVEQGQAAQATFERVCPAISAETSISRAILPALAPHMLPCISCALGTR